MNKKIVLVVTLVVVTMVAGSAMAQLVSGLPVDPQYKFSTPIAPGVAVPDKVESSIGTLNLHLRLSRGRHRREDLRQPRSFARPAGVPHGDPDRESGRHARLDPQIWT